MTTATQPPRVFNKYEKGIPAGAIYIGRGSPWGNEFVIGQHGDRDAVCDQYEAKKMKDPEFLARVRAELKGKNLVCFCKPKRCHGDFLLRVANEPAATLTPTPLERTAPAMPRQASLFDADVGF